MMWGNTMCCMVLGNLSRLERLTWAMFDGVLAAGAPRKLRPDESWEQVVCGIFDKLIYVGRNPFNQCPVMTAGAKDLQGPSVRVEAPTTHSHHQGSEPAWSTNKGCMAPSVRSTVSAVPKWDEGEDNQAEFDYGRRGTLMREGAGSPMAMCASPNKSMKPDLWNVRLWFANTERQLQEEADYPWWPQVLPLTSGVGTAAEESAR